jgi:hypothetical protein
MFDHDTSMSVVGIADPSLALSPTLVSAWYAGHDGFELQHILPDVITRTIASCQAKRVIFLGGSAGGFAALYYSWHVPGSIALVTNPQTNIDLFPEIARIPYRTICRPSLDANTPLSAIIESNLCSCYSRRFDNTVIYLQNATDSLHLRDHFAPFIGSIPLEHQDRLLARVGYWGLRGHTQIPAPVWMSWVRAAIDAPTSEATDIQQTRQEYDPKADHFTTAEPNPDYLLAQAIVDRARAECAESGLG